MGYVHQHVKPFALVKYFEASAIDAAPHRSRPLGDVYDEVLEGAPMQRVEAVASLT